MGIRGPLGVSALLLAGMALVGQAPHAARALKVVPTGAERRVALVIGNGAYGESPLKNPVADARSMTVALQRCGFTVTRLENADRQAMFSALRAFGASLQQGAVGLFYFAGHGMQVKGKNYLIPVGANIAAEDEVPAQALEVDLVLAKMETARNRLNMVILDACRNNPFARSFRGGSTGLAQMDAPAGTYLAFATAPGRTAADGKGVNGLYTQHLLSNLRTPGLKIEDVFKRVRTGVLKDSGQTQMPWDSSSLTGDFYFVPGNAVEAVPEAPPDGAATYQRGLDRLFGRGVEASNTEALVLFLEAADQGYAEAQARLGRMYEQGLGTPANPVKALEYFQLAAGQGNARGLDSLGQAYICRLPGCGLERDDKKAFECFERSAAQGFWRGLMDLAAMHRQGLGTPKDEGRALLLDRRCVAALREAAEQGDLDAINGLGFVHVNGAGVPADPNEGVAQYRRAAEKGHLNAQVNLSLACFRGLGMAANDAEGLAWARRAAAQGAPEGQLLLGQAYAYAKGVARDDAEAARWYRRAADQGQPRAQFLLGVQSLTGKGVAQSDGDAFALFRRAAELGDPDGQRNLGWMYQNGRGTAVTLAEALRWYRKAADQGQVDAEGDLGLMYMNGIGVPQNDVEAARWCRRAAERGARVAQTNLGFLYDKGRGVPQSDTEAVAWYLKAAAQEEPAGLYNLALLYEAGRGVPKDKAKAEELIKKAAALGHAGAKQTLAARAGH